MKKRVNIRHFYVRGHAYKMKKWNNGEIPHMYIAIYFNKTVTSQELIFLDSINFTGIIIDI